MIQKSYKKNYDLNSKYCTVQILNAKVNLPSKQTTKIHKTTIK